ncbi:MAG: asparagine synthase (glutamine-hydrolyzing) [Sulfobacillus thermotolerans]|uniref:asparagine synthase (glutamine-hydrolyzing) n=1 Tax=Sulfobacillus thermotolerans TaxID=338644 RepID=A0ABN5H1F4_9FIRM|nr:asparagine synthase (glutamine-hydrolyzing) [Sulfobacillus thermotolerans]MCY0907342.1 asparagine synthase (glutamine-hydrolyzing) [Sulfobacillus thermotolerans]
MCGIAGWIDWNKDIRQHQSSLEAMVSPLACRGPDGSGTWVTEHAGMGHRRLIVIDPEGGMQPMSRKEGRKVFTIVYNGELYNYLELRRELQSLGYEFRTESDTEVLLTAYIAWGTDCLQHFNGIFAFAIWDAVDQTLFMARDRLGVKPLFFARTPHGILFGSEMKAILAHPEMPHEIGRDGLAEIFALGPAHTPGHGVFKGVQELTAGQFLIFNARGLNIRSYWQLVSHEHPDDLHTTQQTIRDILEDTVKRQLIADVPVITLLSGGLDSSAVTALASRTFQQEGRGPLNTYSIDFVDMEKHFKPTKFQTNLDAPWARRVSEALHTRHHRIVLDTPDLVQNLLAAMRARDLPGMADVDTSLLVFAREIKKEATVGLSGEAADEIFGGYPWFHHPDAIAADTFPWARRLKDRVAILSPEFTEYIQPFAYVDQRYREALQEVPRLQGEDPYAARIREIGYLTLTRFLPTLLDRKDRMTMAVGLEVRVPFCDHRLVEYVWNVPWAMKTEGEQRKVILRQAMRGLLAEDVLWRQKSPYPSTPNPTYFAAMRDQLEEILHEPSSPLHAIVDVAKIREVMRQGPQAEQIPWFGQLMGNAQLFAFLIQAHHWFKEYRVHLA